MSDSKNTFLDTLQPKLYKKYQDIQKKSFSVEKRKFEDHKDDFIKDIERSILTDKEHRDLINLCVFPFSKIQLNDHLNYKFIRAEPLFELGVKNFDWLLCHFEKKLVIFGECKSSININSYNDVIQECEERRKVVNEKEDYVIKEYLGFKPKYTEYVIGVYSSDDEGLIKANLEKNAGFVVWSIDRYKKLLSSRSFSNITNEQKRLIEHNHTKLNSQLKKIPTNVGAYDMFPSSHAITLLRQLILTKEKRGNDLIVSPSILKEKVKNDLFYLDDNYHTDFSSKIINQAEEIGFIEPVSENSIEYRIISNYRHEDGLEKDMIRKYINFKVKKKEMKILDDSHQIARETIEKELKKQRTLFMY